MSGHIEVVSTVCSHCRRKTFILSCSLPWSFSESPTERPFLSRTKTSAPPLTASSIRRRSLRRAASCNSVVPVPSSSTERSSERTLGLDRRSSRGSGGPAVRGEVMYTRSSERYVSLNSCLKPGYSHGLSMKERVSVETGISYGGGSP